MCTQKHSASVNRAFGEHWQALSCIVPWSFVFCVCVCVHEEVESVHFGLVMFAEGQSGLVPKTSQRSQPDLGKYAICVSVCSYTQTVVVPW